jgi:hypothetical protein
VSRLAGISLIAPRDAEEEVVETEEDAKEAKEEKFDFAKLNVPWLLDDAPRTLLVRSCYGLLMDTVLLALQSGDVLLTGSGGTGKTQFQAFLAKRLIENKVPVVLDLEDGAFSYVDSDGKFHAGVRGLSFTKELESRNTVYLFDCRDAGSSTETLTPLIVSAATCVTASPSRGSQGLKSWLKKQNKRAIPSVYMPPWTLPELLAVRANVPEYKVVSEDEVRELYHLYGGNVRNVVVKLVPKEKSTSLAILVKKPLEEGKTTKTPLQLQKEALVGAISQCDSQVLLGYLKARNALGDKSDLLSHALLKIIPSDDMTSFSFAFASEHIASEIFKKDGERVLVSTCFLVAVRITACLSVTFCRTTSRPCLQRTKRPCLLVFEVKRTRPTCTATSRGCRALTTCRGCCWVAASRSASSISVS